MINLLLSLKSSEVCWKGASSLGHHRFALCECENVPFDTSFPEFFGETPFVKLAMNPISFPFLKIC